MSFVKMLLLFTTFEFSVAAFTAVLLIKLFTVARPPTVSCVVTMFPLLTMLLPVSNTDAVTYGLVMLRLPTITLAVRVLLTVMLLTSNDTLAVITLADILLTALISVALTLVLLFSALTCACPPVTNPVVNTVLLATMFCPINCVLAVMIGELTDTLATMTLADI